MSYETYNKLADESEYAAWLYLYGMCASHFSVLVYDLNSFESVEEVNVWVKSIGFEVNKFGGEVKGSPETMLEQSSTMAHKLVIDFKEGQFKVPSCYYEFAKRYKDTDQKYFSGFVTQSANNIFDSTSQKAA
ncbi:MAG: DUF1338 family protein [Bdellovibrionales bacterium]|nr:DUF1338 family protein [Bdellovibrionales bacterium]